MTGQHSCAQLFCFFLSHSPLPPKVKQKRPFLQRLQQYLGRKGLTCLSFPIIEQLWAPLQGPKQKFCRIYIILRWKRFIFSQYFLLLSGYSIVIPDTLLNIISLHICHVCGWHLLPFAHQGSNTNDLPLPWLQSYLRRKVWRRSVWTESPVISFYLYKPSTDM